MHIKFHVVLNAKYMCETQPPPQQHGHQQMIIVRHPGNAGQQQQAVQQQQQQQMLVVSAAANSQQQQMQLLQQQNSLRLAASSLSRGASPATAPSPRQPTAGHFMSARNPLHTTLSGTVLSQPTTSKVEQTMTLAQQAQQAGYGLNLDISGLGTPQLSRSDGEVTPLTPQDQLSRYVEQL